MKQPFLQQSLSPSWHSLTPEHALADVRAALEDAQKLLEEIATRELDQVTYENTMGLLDTGFEPLERAWKLVNHLDAVRNSPELRQVIAELIGEVSAFQSSIVLDERLWQRIKLLHEERDTAKLTAEQTRYLQLTVEEFLAKGAELAPADKQRLVAINQELSECTQRFSEHLIDATNAFEHYVSDAEELSGLPKSALEAAAQSAQARSQDGWRFTLQAPSLMAVLKYADNAELREILWRASSAVGREQPYENSELVAQILRLRQQKALLLGKADFADYILQDRMAKTGDRAAGFVQGLADQVLERAQEEGAELEAWWAKEQGLSESSVLEPWSIAYVANKRREALYDYDPEELRPYFSLDQVMEQLFVLTEELFGLSVRALPSYCGSEPPAEQGQGRAVESWHEEVRAYEIVDQVSARVLGLFYADWHPRENKQSGAWMNPLATNDPWAPEGAEPHLAVICGNMTKPVKGQSAQMLHEEMLTILHEFGHLLHHVLSKTSVRSLSSMDVPWDFIELPSQIMENWCWQPEFLRRFRHQQTGEPISEELLDSLLKARNERSATAFARQLYFAALDLDIHRNPSAWTQGDFDALTRERYQAYLPRTTEPNRSVLERMGHLFSSPTGYAAGYYSYKWAEVLDADAFSLFAKEGLFSAELGRSFRKEILEAGNSRDVEESYRAFAKREPSEQALLLREGIST